MSKAKLKKEENNFSVLQILGSLFLIFAVADFAVSWIGINLTPFMGSVSRFSPIIFGIIGSVLLAVSRAIGETMIVVMAAGLAANLTINPLESTTTITTQIVMILVGDQEFDSPKTQSAFALGLTLFVATLILNYIAQRAVKKYREKYD